jgi:ribosome-associated protein
VDDDLIVNRSVRIPRSELQVSFSASGGPGGQHANRSNTRVELRFDIEHSEAFSPGQRQRLFERLGADVRIVADDERSQLRNRGLAEQRLVERIQAALKVQPPRRATKPTRGSKERRLSSKQQRGQVKAQRRRPGIAD